jgi:ribosome maturation factor RimP
LSQKSGETHSLHFVIRIIFEKEVASLSKPIESIVQEIVEPFLENDGFELVDIEYVKESGSWFLRVFVDKEGGIDIDDCGRISEYLSSKLDEADPIAEPYFLEVSSPGAERPLRKPKDFYRSIHEHVFLTTYEAVNGMKEFEGTLISYDEKTLVIEIKNKKLELPVEKVASARLAIVF